MRVMDSEAAASSSHATKAPPAAPLADASSHVGSTPRPTAPPPDGRPAPLADITAPIAVASPAQQRYVELFDDKDLDDVGGSLPLSTPTPASNPSASDPFYRPPRDSAVRVERAKRESEAAPAKASHAEAAPARRPSRSRGPMVLAGVTAAVALVVAAGLGVRHVGSAVPPTSSRAAASAPRPTKSAVPPRSPSASGEGSPAPAEASKRPPDAAPARAAAAPTLPPIPAAKPLEKSLAKALEKPPARSLEKPPAKPLVKPPAKPLVKALERPPAKPLEEPARATKQGDRPDRKVASVERRGATEPRPREAASDAPPSPAVAGQAATAIPATLSHGDISRILGGSRRAFDACLKDPSRGLDQPLGARQITLRFTVVPDGSVNYPTIDDVTISSAPVGQCIKAAARALRFPGFSGDPVKVDTPLSIPAR